MSQPYLAHLAADGRTQTVKEHLLGTAQLCRAFAAEIGAPDYAQEMALAHDIGKYSPEFQRYLRCAAAEPEHKVKGPDHSTAGAYELQKLPGAIPAALCVAGHHAGLPDLGVRGVDGPDDPTLCGRLQKLLPDYSAWREDIELRPVKPPIVAHNAFSQSFFTRMLYSCLVDADFLDTETFMTGSARRYAYETLPQLWQKLSRTITPWLAADEKPLPTEPALRRNALLNRHRNEILRACLAAGDGAQGAYTLTVPTGGGKTVASLAFALRHAAAHPQIRRIFYVIPYTSIIEQNAAVFRGILGEENVLEHHSGVSYDAADAGAEGQRALQCRLACENWDAPVVVTTNVQFFESLYADRSSRCRKLHNIANSVVIFDEAQMLPLDYLRPCVRAIEELTAHYGVTAVLCTATQPSLQPLFSPGCTLREIVPDTAAQYQFFRRTTLQNIGKISLENLAERMERCGQALAIVNTRKEAQQLFALLPPENRYHLSTLMAPLDRRAALDAIRARLKAGQPCLVAATSMVEAGVDVDFPCVFRAEAGLDSVLQAAGRCNREGKRPAQSSITYVFCTENAPPKEIARYVQILHEIEPEHPDLAAPETITGYFNHLHSFFAREMDRKGILDALNSPRLPLRWVGENFRLMEQDTCQILLPIDEKSRALAEKLPYGFETRRLLRLAAPYLVSVYRPHYEQLLRSGAKELLPDLAVLTDCSLYRPDTGLALHPEEGKTMFV